MQTEDPENPRSPDRPVSPLTAKFPSRRAKGGLKPKPPPRGLARASTTSVYTDRRKPPKPLRSKSPSPRPSEHNLKSPPHRPPSNQRARTSHIGDPEGWASNGSFSPTLPPKLSANINEAYSRETSNLSPNLESVQFLVERRDSLDSDASSDASEDPGGVSSFEGGHSSLSTPQDPPTLAGYDPDENTSSSNSGGGSNAPKPSVNSASSALQFDEHQTADGIVSEKALKSERASLLQQKKHLRDVNTVSEEIRVLTVDGTASRLKQMFQSHINMNKSSTAPPKPVPIPKRKISAEVKEKIRRLSTVRTTEASKANPVVRKISSEAVVARPSVPNRKQGFSLSLPQTDTPDADVKQEDPAATKPKAPSMNASVANEVTMLATTRRMTKFKDLFQSKINAANTHGSPTPMGKAKSAPKGRTTRLGSTVVFGGVRNKQTLQYKAILRSLNVIAGDLQKEMKTMSDKSKETSYIIVRDTKLHEDKEGENAIRDLKVGDLLEVTSRRMLSRKSVLSERVYIAQVLFEETEGYVRMTTFRGQVIMCPNEKEIIDFADRVTEFAGLIQVVEKLLSEAVKNKRIVTKDEIMSACAHGRADNIKVLENALDGFKLVTDVPQIPQSKSLPHRSTLTALPNGSVRSHTEKYRTLSVQGIIPTTKKEMEVLRKNSFDDRLSPKAGLPPLSKQEVKREPSKSKERETANETGEENMQTLPSVADNGEEIGEEEVFPKMESMKSEAMDSISLDSISDVSVPRESILEGVPPPSFNDPRKSDPTYPIERQRPKLNQLATSLPVQSNLRNAIGAPKRAGSVATPPGLKAIRVADEFVKSNSDVRYSSLHLRNLMGNFSLSSMKNGVRFEDREPMVRASTARASTASIALTPQPRLLQSTQIPVTSKTPTPALANVGRNTKSRGKMDWLLGESSGIARKSVHTQPARKKKKIESLPPLTVCSPSDIVYRCTHPEVSVNEYKPVLLLCHSAFISTKELLQLFLGVYLDNDVDMYFIDNEDEMTRLEESPKLLKNRKLKVVIMLKFWMQSFPDDFSSEEAQAQTSKIIDRIIEVEEKGSSGEKKAQQLRTALLKTQQRKAPINAGVGKDWPEPKIKGEILRTNTIDLMTVSCEEIARQLCLSDFEIFKQIEPREFIGQHWVKRKHLAENVAAMIEQFNRTNFWTQQCILKHHKVSKRAECIGRLLRVCTYLEKMNNLNSLAAINAGLQASPIHRLKKTFARLNVSQWKLVDKYQEFFRVSGNYKTLRERTKVLNQPGIPHLALFLTDLTFIEDGNQDTKQGQVNFRKYQLLSERIEWIRMFQQYGFHFKPVKPIHKYFKETMKVIPEEFLYTLSLQFEPRT